MPEYVYPSPKCPHGFDAHTHEDSEGWVVATAPPTCCFCEPGRVLTRYKLGGDLVPTASGPEKRTYTLCEVTKGCICFAGHTAPCLLEDGTVPGRDAPEPPAPVCSDCGGPMDLQRPHIVAGDVRRHLPGACSFDHTPEDAT